MITFFQRSLTMKVLESFPIALFLSVYLNKYFKKLDHVVCLCMSL